MGLTSLVFTLTDNILHALNGMRNYPGRKHARQRCLEFLFEHQEEDGSWAGYYPPIHFSILALVLEGYDIDSLPVRRAVQGLDGFIWSDHRGKRVQATASPVWDTILMTIGLLDSGLPADNRYVGRSMAWIRNRQILEPQGDWKVLRPTLRAGAFSFQYHNIWTPDLDDTAAAVLAFMK